LGITSAPAISGELIVFGCKAGTLHALHIRTGKAIWKSRIGQTIMAPPVISGSVVWIQAGDTFAVNLFDGRVLWKANLGNSVQSAPVVTEDVVYLASMEGEIYALE